MNTLSDLKKTTKQFFERHWDKSGMITFPEWSENWTFVGSVPSNNASGCYAWLKGDEVVYIGVALNNGVPGYEKHSLGTRISKYWTVLKDQMDDNGNRKYEPTPNLKTAQVDSIVTLPFADMTQIYLAAALEIFLIAELSPSSNFIYKKR